ncbi:hypothetical protein IKF02_01005 [Candidatus Saccharibacteria bacterium]|nr:hypothetical protein [Candidatus Saccharibacteria bacterium]
MVQCPKCGSENVTVQMVTTGMKTKNYSNGIGAKAHNAGRSMLAVGTLGMSNLFIRKRRGEEETKIGSKTVFICQNCGFSGGKWLFNGSAFKSASSSSGEELNFSSNDPTTRKAVEICIKKKKFSTALLQTYLGRGHNYVTSLGTWLADIGVIEPPNNSNKPRNVLINSLEEFDQLANKK